MDNRIKILVRCPSCKKSLMNSRLLVDGLPSIKLQGRLGNQTGYVYLSQVYGSYDKEFRKIKNIEGAEVSFSCPFCNTPFPEHQKCACGASMIALGLQVGGIIKICTRNGCENHAMEFVDAKDAFLLFQSQDEKEWD